jgi:hypothetical protein
MQVLKPRSTAFGVAAFSALTFAVALAWLFFNQGKLADARGQEAKSSAKAAPAKVEPEARHSVARQPRTIRFRVVDAAGAAPIGLARVVIDNGNLAPDLGDYSDAVTWPDGRAIITHRFFVWDERRGDQTVRREMIFQGPGILVSADGYEPRKMPLSELLEKDKVDFDRRGETILTLRRERPAVLDLADLAADYIYGNGFVYEHLEVTRGGRYHFQWRNDVRTDLPHDDDRFESRGRCSIVDGVLHLLPEGPFSSELRDMMGNNFVPIRWGARRYLIPEKERLVFCSVVNQGTVPQYMRNGRFSLDEVDRHKPPEGRPDVPEAWAPFLLQKPVAGAITELLPNHVAVLSAGAKDGLKAGMEIVRENRLFSSQIRVLFAEPDRSLVRISAPNLSVLPESRPLPFDMLLRPDPLAVGERFSSLASESPRDR